MRRRRFSLHFLAVVSLIGCSGPPAMTDGGRDAGPRVDAFVPPPSDGGDPTQIFVHYEPTGTGFYRMPWPSDARLTADGTPDFSDFPRRRGLLDTTLTELEAHVHGFATMPVAYFALYGAVTDATLPSELEALDPTSPIQMIDLSPEGCGTRLPLEIAFAATGDQLRDDNMLQVANAIGTVLRPRVPYGVIIRRDFGTQDFRHTARPAEFDRALNDTSGSDALSRSLQPLRDCDIGFPLDEIAVATVFTPQEPLADMRALYEYVIDPDAIATRPIQDWRVSDGWSRRRYAITTRVGTMSVPVFQEGVSPYTDSGGALVFDADHRPVVQRWEDVAFAVAMRDLPSPPDPRPVLIFMDGTGWEPWDHLYSNWVGEALDAGYVIFSFMPQFHGGRAGFIGSTEVSTFNLPNPPAGRTNFQQQAAETSFFVRTMREQIAALAGLPALDLDHIVYGGHSQGALCGAIVAAFDDRFRGFVLSGLSSFLTLTILYRQDIIDFEAAVEVLYEFRGTLDRFHPLLQVMQLGAEVVDPHNYVPRWHGWEANPGGNNVFVSNGHMDATTTPRAIEHMTMCANMQPIDPPGWEIDPVGVWDGVPVSLPAQGNATSSGGGPLTIATFLDPNGPHGTIYRNTFDRQLALHFWNTARIGVPELASVSEFQCGEGADEDQDGLTDCDDPDCRNVPPCVEGPCDNMMDDDANGLTDCEDPVCAGADNCRETMCDDTMDNDMDGATDCADSDCRRSAPCTETSCRDGVDNDRDGDIDCADSECSGSDDCHERNCGDSRDDDRDGMIDCADPECHGSLLCPELVCTDGLDDDSNGWSDCADPACRMDASCARTHESACNDTNDNDGDGAIDCADADCALDAACTGGNCADGDLGRQTGVAVFSGMLSGRANEYPPADCIGLGLSDDAPDIALSWTAPAAGQYYVSTRGSSMDTVLSILGPDCDASTDRGCDDNEGPLTSSGVTVTMAAGETIVIVIGAQNRMAAGGTVLLHILPR